MTSQYDDVFLCSVGVRDLHYKLVFAGQDVRIHNPVSPLEDDNNDGRGKSKDSAATGGPQDEDHATEECGRQQDLDRALEVLGLTPEQQDLFLKISRAPDTLSILAKCMAPEVSRRSCS